MRIRWFVFGLFTYLTLDNLLKLKISEGARAQIMTRGPFWLSTALDKIVHIFILHTFILQKIVTVKLLQKVSQIYFIF